MQRTCVMIVYFLVTSIFPFSVPKNVWHQHHWIITASYLKSVFTQTVTIKPIFRLMWIVNLWQCLNVWTFKCSWFQTAIQHTEHSNQNRKSRVQFSHCSISSMENIQIHSSYVNSIARRDSNLRHTFVGTIIDLKLPTIRYGIWCVAVVVTYPTQLFFYSLSLSLPFLFCFHFNCAVIAGNVTESTSTQIHTKYIPIAIENHTIRYANTNQM